MSRATPWGEIPDDATVRPDNVDAVAKELQENR